MNTIPAGWFTFTTLFGLPIGYWSPCSTMAMFKDRSPSFLGLARDELRCEEAFADVAAYLFCQGRKLQAQQQLCLLSEWGAGYDDLRSRSA